MSLTIDALAARVRDMMQRIRKHGPEGAVAANPTLARELLRDLARLKILHPDRHAVLCKVVGDQMQALLASV